MSDPYVILLRDGKKVDALTDAALRRAEKALGYPLTVRQGSYNPGGVAASGGTHDAGGVVDLMPWDWEKKVVALRAVGFAAWHRATVPGLWGEHVHAVLIDHPRLSPEAEAQVVLYLKKRNGLKSNLPDTDPGWTNTARYTVESFDADVARARIAEHVAAKQAKIAAKKSMVARLRGQIRVLREKMAGLPKP